MDNGTPRSEFERDRDEGGRARSSRPRDGLGRPLPRDASGVARQPEGIVRSAAETLRSAQSLLDAGAPFHAHEVFEDAWKGAEQVGTRRPGASQPASGDAELWRGLAQLAVGLTHAARGNRRGAASLLSRAAETLSPSAGQRPHGVQVDALIAWAQTAAAQVLGDAGSGPVVIRAPRIAG